MSDASDALSMLAHVVVFTLHDNSSEARQKLVDDCYRRLADHPGIVHFSAGMREPELDRPVNDREFDVALHVVFQTRADHDRYQTAEAHLKFIEENKANWQSVRVFDSNVR